MCINAMFSPPNDTDATAIMNILARRNNERVGTNFAIEPPLDSTAAAGGAGCGWVALGWLLVMMLAGVGVRRLS